MESLWIDILLLLAGLGLLLLGGNWVTSGAVSLARRMGVSGLVIGLTVVAFGSSTPDLAVCLTSTLQGKSSMAIGDVVGAAIFDLLLAVGVTALIHPIRISDTGRRGFLPLVALAAAALFFLADDRLIDGAQLDRIDRSDGLVMLLFFTIFMVYTLRSGRNESPSPAPEKQPEPKRRTWLAVGMVVGGLAALTFGGQWIVKGASAIAVRAGMSEAMVGLTIVAVGSSLPDLVTSATAAFRGQTGIAVGNLFGSCVFNLLFGLGVCALFRPLNSAGISFPDYGTLLIAALLIWMVASLRSRTVSRTIGGLLVMMYAFYILSLAH